MLGGLGSGSRGGSLPQSWFSVGFGRGAWSYGEVDIGGVIEDAPGTRADVLEDILKVFVG
jgi:hypothetical protein